MKFKIAIITIVLVCTQVVYSQTKTVTGSVVDDDGAPLPGVSVLFWEQVLGLPQILMGIIQLRMPMQIRNWSLVLSE